MCQTISERPCTCGDKKWISTKDSLPPVNKRVLLYSIVTGKMDIRKLHSGKSIQESDSIYEVDLKGCYSYWRHLPDVPIIEPRDECNCSWCREHRRRHTSVARDIAEYNRVNGINYKEEKYRAALLKLAEKTEKWDPDVSATEFLKECRDIINDAMVVGDSTENPEEMKKEIVKLKSDLDKARAEVAHVYDRWNAGAQDGGTRERKLQKEIKKLEDIREKQAVLIRMKNEKLQNSLDRISTYNLRENIRKAIRLDINDVGYEEK